MTEVVESNGYGSMSPQTREAVVDGRHFRRVHHGSAEDIHVDLAAASHPVVDPSVVLPLEIVTPPPAEPQGTPAARVHGASGPQIDPQVSITSQLRALGISTPGFDQAAANRRVTKKRFGRRRG